MATEQTFPDASAKAAPNFPKEFDPEKMSLSMGPSHPSTHGVLRIQFELDGETVTKAEPIIGYLHRGDEKIAENMTYNQFVPYTDRLDYIAPLANNAAYAHAVEQLAGLKMPPRVDAIRVRTPAGEKRDLVWAATLPKSTSNGTTVRLSWVVMDAGGFVFTPEGDYRVRLFSQQLGFIDDTSLTGRVKTALVRDAGRMATEVNVTTYRGKPLEKGQKSVTVTLVFRSPTRTLTGDEVESTSTWTDWEDISEGRLRGDWATVGSFSGPQDALLRARYAAQSAAASSQAQLNTPPDDSVVIRTRWPRRGGARLAMGPPSVP